MKTITSNPSKPKTGTTFSPQESPILSSATKRLSLKAQLFYQYWQVASQALGHPIAGLKGVWQMFKRYKAVFQEPLLTKVAKVDGRYFYRMAMPGFPSVASATMQRNELNRVYHFQESNGVRSLLLSITKNCPLQCEHCYEWNNLNQGDTLSEEQIQAIVQKYQAFGTTHLVFSGGEPMLRFNTIINCLQQAAPGTDFWVVTSGLSMTVERAKALKAAGLTGVLISLDHHSESEHNTFRGYRHAYRNAIQAAIYAKEAKLVTALSLCARPDYTTLENLTSYLDLAKDLGVTFVQIFEARASGRYQGQAVNLSPNQIDLLEQLFMDYNSKPQWTDYPIINYQGFIKRKYGCFGGDRFFYIDADGDAHICPFCSKKVGSALAFSPQDLLNLMGQFSCHVFDKMKI